MKSTARKRKLKKVRAMAKKLKVKLTYKKNGTYKYKSLKRLLNDIKKKKGCKRCVRCKRCKKCKRCVRCKRCKKCNCNRRNRFGMDVFSSTNSEGFDWEDDYRFMPAPAKKKTPAGMATAVGIWKTNTADEKKETWAQKLAKKATEEEWKGDIPARGTELAKKYKRIYLNNYNRIKAQASANIPRAPASIYENAKIIEEPAFGKKNRFG
jgi:hypothetical protein